MYLGVGLQCFFLFSVASAACPSSLKCLLTNGTTVVIGSHSICCNGKAIPKVVDGIRQSCCCDSQNGTQEAFNPAQEICCEGKIFPKIDRFGQEKQCCGTRPYALVRDNLCCAPHSSRRNIEKFILYTSQIGENDACCGNKKYNRTAQVCCRDDNFEVRLYDRDQTKECCQRDYISKATQECALNKETGRLISMLKFIRPCGNDEIDTREDLCCNGVPHRNVREISSSSCCGDETFNVNTHQCCNDDILVARNMKCCGSHPDGFNPRTQLCCNETAVAISHYMDRCCGAVTMDSRTHVCCNDQAYDKSTVKICRGSGDKCSAVGVYETCCGSEKLNQRSVCCQAGTVYNYNYFQTLKTKSSDNSCCTSYIKGSTNAFPYSDQTEECQRGHTPTVTPKQPKCGRLYFDANTDLCCNNKLYPGGIMANQTCCQYNAYNPATQSCCDYGRVYNSTSCDKRCGNQNFNPKTQLCCQDQRYDKEPGKTCCGNQMYNPSKQTCCGSKVAANPNQCHRKEHPICTWLCEQDDKKIRRQIRTGKIDICKTNAYVTRIGRKSNFRDVTRLQLEGRKNRLYHHNQNSFRVKKLFHPTCLCDREPSTEVRRKIVVITDKSIRDNRVDLTDSDYILPYTGRIRKTLMKYWKKRCNISTILVTADVVDEIFDFIKVKIEKQKESTFYES